MSKIAPSLVAKYCKMRENFLYIHIPSGKFFTGKAFCKAFSRVDQYTQNLQILQGYVFRILSHLATKFCYVATVVLRYSLVTHFVLAWIEIRCILRTAS